MTIPLYETLNLTKNDFIEQLQTCFDQDLSLPEVAKIFKTSPTTIWNWSNRLGIKRTRAATLRNKDWLSQKYLTEQLNMAEIASLLNVSYQAVDWWLNAHKIPHRPISEIQLKASEKRPYTNLHTDCSFQSRGYCGWYKDIFYYRSINEVVWYMMNEDKYSSIINEPFVHKNYKPDFLVDNKLVIEIKGGPSPAIEHEYGIKGEQIRSLGYEYQIIYVQRDFPDEYSTIRNYLRNHGAITGHGYHITENLLASKSDLNLAALEVSVTTL